MQASPAEWAPVIVAGFGFPPGSRLLDPAEFKSVFERSVVSSDTFFRVYAQVTKGPGSRLGMAVSRKVDPRAVVRNRIKRVIRESFRLHHPPGPDFGTEATQPGRDYVVLAAQNCAGASKTQLADSLAGHWQEVGRKLELAELKSGEAGTKAE